MLGDIQLNTALTSPQLWYSNKKFVITVTAMGLEEITIKEITMNPNGDGLHLYSTFHDLKSP